jgi:membrane-associated phospholipid phosphatase
MARLLKFLLIMTVLSLSMQCGAKKCFADDNDNYGLNLRQFPITYGYLKDTFIAPLQFIPSDWNKVGLVALGAGICYTQDTSIRNYFQKNRTGNSDDASRFFMHFGDGSFTAAILTSLYVYGEVNGDEKFKRAGMLGVESIVVNSILTSAVKLTLQRPLPDSGLPYDTWYPTWNSINDLAFPSGHTSAAFAGATIIATEFSDTPLVPVIAYTTASLTALAMLDMDQHWASDLLPGAALGYYTAKKIESMQTRKSTQAYRKSSDFAFFPMVSGESVSILTFYSF